MDSTRQVRGNADARRLAHCGIDMKKLLRTPRERRRTRYKGNGALCEQLG